MIPFFFIWAFVGGFYFLIFHPLVSMADSELMSIISYILGGPVVWLALLIKHFKK